ncbi:MAG: S1/P1 nuclease [Gammaproteobacteria bacterium]
MNKCAQVLLVLLCYINTAQAWFSTPHMLVAEIAYQHLDADVRQRADQLIAMHADKYPKSADFVTASLWADDIKSTDSRYSAWHYVSLTFEQPTDPMPTLANFPVDNHVSWAIEHDKAILSDPKQSDEEKAYALRRLIHWVGDIHEPEHATTHTASQYPKGNDYGGTHYLLSAESAMPNLHYLWDSGVGLWVADKMRPLSENDKIAIQEEAAVLLKQAPISLGSMNPYHWAIDSHQLGRHYAHGFGLTYKGTPSEQYVREGQTVSRDQVTLAGLRLAAILNEVL